jgi:putative ABC transport system permease protein
MSASGLQVLRAHPLLGRIFAPDEDQPGKDKVVLLTESFWQNRFGGGTNIVGGTIQLNGESHSVIGILPRRFLLWDKADFVLPTAVGPNDVSQRSAHWLQVLGRLKPGVTLPQAQAEMKALAARLRPLYPAYKKDWSVMLVPLQEQVTGEIRPTLLILFGAVGCVLLIACANVANLLLAKASGRQREMAIRTALGASRFRIIRQLLAESLLLSLSGALLGVLLAYLGVDALARQSAVYLPRAQEISLDWRVLAFALVVGVLAGVVFGLVPALQVSRPDLDGTLKEGARTSGGRSRNRVRSTLIVAEVALSLVLLIGAGLLLNSFVRILNVPPGIDTRNALTMQLSLAERKYPNAEQRAAFCERLIERIASLPQVSSAGVVEMPPLASWGQSTSFSVIGRTEQPASGFGTDYNFCTPDYFRAVGTPLVRGRLFDRHDRTGAPRVVVISETLARQYFPNEDPLGKRIHLEVFTGKVDEGWEIVGIVGDLRQRGLDEPPHPCVYRPQWYAWGSNWHLVIRTAGAPLTLANSIRQAILGLDADLPAANVRTLEAAVSASIDQRRFTMLLLAGFAGVALLLAAIGLYGVIAYSVAQRAREIGIRTALGATRYDVLALVLRQGLVLAGAGVLLGIGGALGLTRVLREFLYEVKPADPTTFAGVSLVLLLVALVASWLPARHAAHIDPMTALRQD